MNNDYFHQLANKALSLPIHPSKLFPPSPYYRFLQALVEDMQPSLSVVLGVCGGGDCLHMCQPGHGLVVGIDVTYDHHDQIAYIYKHHSNFLFWLGDSVRCVEEVFKNFRTVDILFIDTTHTYEQTWAEFKAWQPYLSDKAVVCFDDLFRKEMGNFWQELPEPKTRLDFLHIAEEGGGFGVWWK